MQGREKIAQTQNEIFDIKHTILKVNQISGDTHRFNQLSREELIKQPIKNTKEVSSVSSTARNSPNIIQINEKSDDGQAQKDAVLGQPDLINGIIQDLVKKQYSILSDKDSYIQINCKLQLLIHSIMYQYRLN